MEILELIKIYGTQEQCIAKLEEVKWKGKPVCPYCKSEISSKRKGSFRHQCRSCNASYSVLIGTIMESTKLSLPKWFLAMFLIINAKKGISSLQLARDLGVNKNTAWYLQKRIRQAMNEDDQILNGLVHLQIAEIYNSQNKTLEAAGVLENLMAKDGNNRQYILDAVLLLTITSIATPVPDKKPANTPKTQIPLETKMDC